MKEATRREIIISCICRSCAAAGNICGCDACARTRAVSYMAGSTLCSKCAGPLEVARGWVIEEEYSHGLSVILTLSSDPREEKKATWYFHRGEISFRCWGCGTLNGMPKQAIDETGHTKYRMDDDHRRCFACHACGCNLGLYFESWDEAVHRKGG